MRRRFREFEFAVRVAHVGLESRRVVAQSIKRVWVLDYMTPWAWVVG